MTAFLQGCVLGAFLGAAREAYHCRWNLAAASSPFGVALLLALAYWGISP